MKNGARQNKPKPNIFPWGWGGEGGQKKRHELYLSVVIRDDLFLLYTFPVRIMSAHLFENCNYPLHTHTHTMLILSLKCWKHSQLSLSGHLIILQIIHPNFFSPDQGRPFRYGAGACFVNGGTMVALVSGPSVNHHDKKQTFL